MTITLGAELSTISCGKCGGVYAITDRYRAKKEEEGGGWHCPYCEVGWGYFQDNENAKLKREILQVKADRERIEAKLASTRIEAEINERRRRAQKAKATMLKRRLVEGKCPCCKRSFPDIRSHIAESHPDYAKAPAPSR